MRVESSQGENVTYLFCCVFHSFLENVFLDHFVDLHLSLHRARAHFELAEPALSLGQVRSSEQ